MEILRDSANEVAPGIKITAGKQVKKEVPETSGLDELLEGLEGMEGLTVK